MKSVTAAVGAISLILAGCSASSPVTPWAIEPPVMQINELSTVHISIDAGSVIVSSTAQQGIDVSGTINDPDRVTYDFDQAGEAVTMVFDYDGNALRQITPAPVEAQITVPQGITLTVESQGAAVRLQDFYGTANISSVAGEITAQRIDGDIKLYSNRGSITVLGSEGSLGVVSNYGRLSLHDVRGSVSASNVIGSIQMSALIGLGDTVSLENDHGNVEISMAQGSSLSVYAHSSSGTVICLPSALITQARTCSGTLGEGEGTLAVRTVSGLIKLEQTASP